MSELETRRLWLRQWREADRDAFADLNADPEVMRHFVRPFDRATSDAMLDRYATLIERTGWGLWAVEVKDGPPFIGVVGLAPVDLVPQGPRGIEVGWRLARLAWGHGYATEAARAALGYGFGTLGLREILSITTVGNLPSRAVMERLGMRRDRAGDFEHPRVPEGHPLRLHVVYRLKSTAYNPKTVLPNGLEGFAPPT